MGAAGQVAPLVGVWRKREIARARWNPELAELRVGRINASSAVRAIGWRQRRAPPSAGRKCARSPSITFWLQITSGNDTNYLCRPQPSASALITAARSREWPPWRRAQARAAANAAAGRNNLQNRRRSSPPMIVETHKDKTKVAARNCTLAHTI